MVQIVANAWRFIELSDGAIKPLDQCFHRRMVVETRLQLQRLIHRILSSAEPLYALEFGYHDASPLLDIYLSAIKVEVDDRHKEY